MSDNVVRKLLGRIQRLEQRSTQTRRATVTATSPLTVQVAGSDVEVTPQGKLATYTPSVNDEVVCIQQGRTLFVLGEFD